MCVSRTKNQWVRTATRQLVLSVVICGTINLLTACSDVSTVDNPVKPVIPTEELAQETFVHEAWMDRTVKPGDSFWHFALGTWLQNHDEADKGIIGNSSAKQTMELEEGLASYASPNHTMQLILGPLASEEEQQAVLLKALAQLKDGDDITKADVMRNIGKMADMGFSALITHDLYVFDRVFKYVIEPGRYTQDYYPIVTRKEEMIEVIKKIIKKRLDLETDSTEMNQRIGDVAEIELWIKSFADEWTHSSPKPAIIGQGMPMLKSTPVPALTALSRATIRRTAENDELMTAFREAFHVDSNTYYIPEMNKVFELFDKYDVQSLQLYLKFYLAAKLYDVIFSPGTPPESIFQALSQAAPSIFLDYHKAMLLKDVDCEGALQLLEELRGLLAQRISNIDWLSDATKAKAQEKLKAMLFNVGGPEKLFNANFKLTGKTPIEELLQYKEQTDAYLRNELAGKPCIGDNLWEGFFVFPTGVGLNTVNAFYDPSSNQLVIMPAFLRGELFPADKDNVMRYATLQIFGHEISHAFDGNGAKYDALGNKADWWTAEDKAMFEHRQQVMVDRFNELEQMPGVPADGYKTRNENIADLGGFNLAWEMWNRKLKAEGLTGEALRHQQRQFFVAHAHLWQIDDPEEILQLRLTDVHSAYHNRINGIYRLLDDWYTLFGVEPGDKLYVKPEDRVKIW